MADDARSNTTSSFPDDAVAFDPLLDVALFLAYLQATDVHPLHGRWLPPRHFQALGPCLSPSVLCREFRSERQSGRLPFAHYLAESLGLLTLASNLLKPSPVALGWLERPASEQIHDLWAAWLTTSDENRQRWTRYHLPGYKLRDPIGFAQRIVGLLSSVPDGQPWALQEIDSQMFDELVPWWERDDQPPPEVLLREMLSGPLAWLGLVRPTAEDELPACYQLTLLGAWLLDRPGVAPPPDHTRPLRVADLLDIQVPAESQLAAILDLAGWTELGPGPCLHFTPASLIRAREQGGTWQDLLAALTRHTAPLTPTQRDNLRNQFQRIATVSLQPSLLLKTPDASIMTELWHTPSTRSHLGSHLSPDLAVVQTPSPAALVKALHTQGLAVQSSAPVSPRSSTSLLPGDAYWLTVSFLVHSYLARRLGLTSAPPTAILETVVLSLEPAQLATAQAAATQAIARLEQALDGPSPVSPAISEETLVRRLEAAIHEGQTVHLRYWAAARGEVTDRQVEPQRIEWRGEHAYLVAHCHLRGDERTFRLDRILDIEG
jgi:hypothetical protein